MISFTYLISSPLRLLAIVALISAAVCNSAAQTQTSSANSGPATVTLHWGARTGVSRYRLQIANDARFTDIVLDRVVAGLEYRVTDLPIGKYFWRVAPVGTMLSQGSPGVIEIRAPANPVNETQPTPAPTQSAGGANTHGGWYAAIGMTAAPILAHLRSTTREDIVTAGGTRVLALDSASGVELWNVRLSGQLTLAPIAARSANGLDNIALISGAVAAMLDGRTGHVLWRATLPATAASAVAVSGKLFAIDNSLQRLFVVQSGDGKVMAQAQLPRRAIGAPAGIEEEPRGVMIAMNDGRIQLIDDAGKVLRSGSAESAVTTPPLFVRSARGNFVLVGTKDGLTALDAKNLRPLGRINLKGDTPRGALIAVDVDGDGIPEVVMLTEHGQVFVVKSDEGRIVWTADARHAETVAFADVNGDGMLDLLMMGREGSAFALSGREGTVIWKEETTSAVANHAPAPRARSLVVVPTALGTLVVTSDARGSGLRAVAFSTSASR